VTVLIAPSELLSSLKQRVSTAGGDVLAFTDADALRALEAIVGRRPGVVVMERLFAASPRGTALINRIKSDSALTSSEIRIVAHDSDYTRVLARQTDPPGNSATSSGSLGVALQTAAAAVAAPPAPVQPLDHRGTRRAPRIRIAGAAPVLVDGNQAALVDLSIFGAQVVSQSVLKPNQRVRMALLDDAGTLRFNAAVAWASFEIPPASGPRYRAGIEFIDADRLAVDSYCHRHKS